jgi:OmpA-OmpF porin, OOP family
MTTNKLIILDFIRHIILSFIFSYLSFIGNSQNLVQNSSFEEFVDFSYNNQMLWHKVQDTDTPDYFCLSKSNSFNNIFNKYTGGTNAKTGDGFVGFFCYRVNPDRNIRNVREYIETTLMMPLEKDSLYKIEISLCLDAESNVFISNYGVCFSSSPIWSGKKSNLFLLKPQIEFDLSVLESSNHWVTLESLYRADGTEKFAAFGNFRTDKATSTQKLESKKEKGKSNKWSLTKKEKAAYYYIDDVVVRKAMIGKSPDLHHPDLSVVIDPLFDIDKIQVDSLIVLENIIFEFGKSVLLPQSYIEISKLYQFMNSNPNIRIKLEGHTDNVGNYDFNLQLSVKRVESVAFYLTKLGINSSRIEYAGYSYTFPLATNETEEGRKMNRRVAFKITEK